MRLTLEDWQNGWCEVEIGMDADEIDGLIDALQKMKSEPGRHFHASSDYKDAAGVGRVTFYLKNPDEEDNARLTSLSYLPGERIDGTGESD